MLPHRRTIKEGQGDAREKLRRDCREIGRERRRSLLQQHRNSMSPGDLQAKLHADTMATIRAQLTQPDSEGPPLTEADIDELLRDVQDQVMAEIAEELAALERSERQDVQRAAAMAEEHQQYLRSAGEREGALLCPVCKQAHLAQRHGWLVCPAEAWQLNLAAECLQLDDVRARLAAAYEEHAASCAAGQLAFRVQEVFGSTSLVCTCAACRALTVVL